MALTLREVCGLTTEEIGQAFLTPAPTLAQRIVRAKAKIRDAQAQQVPYMLVVGDRDQQAGTVSVRERRQGDLGAQPLPEFLAQLEEQRKARS